MGKIINVITDKLADSISISTNKSIDHLSRQMIKLYCRINYVFFKTPLLIHKYSVKYASGSHAYYSIVYVLINEYKVNLAKPVTYYATSMGCKNEPVLSLGEHLNVSYKGKQIRVVSYADVDVRESTSDKKLEWIQLEIESIHGLKILNEFAYDADQSYRTYLNNGINIYTNSPEGGWMMSGLLTGRKMGTVILRDNMHEQIINDVRYFLDNEKWFTDRGITHKLGLLFHGPPGTGKTSMVNNIATMTKKTYII